MNTFLELLFNYNLIVNTEVTAPTFLRDSLTSFYQYSERVIHADLNNFIKDNLNLNISLHSSGNNVIYDQYQNIYHGLLVDYEFFFFGLFIAFLLASLLLLISYIFGTQLKILDKEKLSLFECGFIPLNDSRQLFTVNFYRISILFILFDIEISFLFPWSTSFLSSILQNDQMVLSPASGLHIGASAQSLISGVPLVRFLSNLSYNSFSLFYFYSIYLFLTLLIIGIYYEYKAKALELS